VIAVAQPLNKESEPDSAVSGEAVMRARAKVLALAEEQGVKPVEKFEDLLGDFWPEDESIDDFLETLYQWRREGLPRELPE
jgi:hypothetical protein